MTLGVACYRQRPSVELQQDSTKITISSPEDYVETRTLATAALLSAALLWADPLWAVEINAADLAKKVASLVEQDETLLIEIFKQLHANPELAFQEVKTAALVAKVFKDCGYETHTGIGKTGVVGILKNGPGPV